MSLPMCGGSHRVSMLWSVPGTATEKACEQGYVDLGRSLCRYLVLLYFVGLKSGNEVYVLVRSMLNAVLLKLSLIFCTCDLVWFDLIQTSRLRRCSRIAESFPPEMWR